MIQRDKPKEVSRELQQDLTKALDTLFTPGSCVCIDMRCTLHTIENTTAPHSTMMPHRTATSTVTI